MEGKEKGGKRGGELKKGEREKVRDIYILKKEAAAEFG